MPAHSQVMHRQTAHGAQVLAVLAAAICAACAAAAAMPAAAADAPSRLPACTAPRPAASGPTYMLASQADIVALLPPPPAQDSAIEQQDLRAVLEAQRDAHARGTTARAVADANASCGRFADALGPGLIARSDTAALAFLDRAALQGASITGPAKTYWRRARPFAVSNQVERLGDVAPGAGARCSPTANGPKDPTGKQARKAAQELARSEQELAHSSYPSGHAAFATVCAILLSDMVPEKRAQVFARARDFEHARMIVGAHFPSDLAGGRIAGTVAATLMMQNAAFEHDYAAARVQLRAALGLPPDPRPRQSAQTAQH